MSANVPNIEGSVNPNVVSGGQFGVILANSTTETLGAYGNTGIAQYATTGTTTGFTAGSGTASKSDSTFTGNTGSTAYTVGDVVRALKLLGLIAS